MSGSVEKALKVLELLSTYDAPVRLAELSRALGMNKSTTHRMLEKMVQAGYVVQDEDSGRYRLTIRMWEVGARAFRHFNVRNRARPYLEQIGRDVEETVVLGILDQHEVVIVDRYEARRVVQTYSPLGSRAPLHCSALGKAFLMADADRLLKRMRRPLHAFTARTITTVRELRLAIGEAKRQGVAVSVDEYVEGVSGVSAPVIGLTGTAMAALGVQLPTVRAKGEHLEKVCALVRAKAGELSRAIGHTQEAVAVS